MLTINDMIKHHKENKYHFFDDDTMQFFGSKIESDLYNDKYFITSEKNFDGTKRLFTVRKYDWETAQVEDIPKFQAFPTLHEAKDFLINILAKEA